MEYLQKVDDVYLLTREASVKLAEFEKLAKEIEAKQKELKESILKEMEETNTIKIETEELTITYVAPTYREAFDTKKFRVDNPDLYDKYVKFSEVKSSIRMKVR